MARLFSWLPSLLAVFCVAGCSKQPEPPPASEPRTDPTAAVAPEPLSDAVESASREERFPTFGVALTPPMGWAAEPIQQPAGFLARWLPEDAGPDDWSQFTAEVRPLADGETARQAVASLERRGYQRSATRLDGLAADRLDAPETVAGESRRPLPSPIVIARRGSRLWRLVFLTDGRSDRSGVDSVIASWRWEPIRPVAEHLRLGPPQALFGGVGAIRLPAAARRDGSLGGADSVAYVVYDYRGVQDALTFAFTKIDGEPSGSLSAQAILYAEQIEQGTRLGKTLPFEPLAGRDDLFVSPTLSGEYQTEAGKTVERVTRFAIWRPRLGVFVRVQVVVNNEAFGGIAEVERAVRVVAESLASCESKPGSGPPAP